MAIKDGEIIENKDLGKKDPGTSIAEEKLPVEEEIKNAHASGDGSFGRNDESLPDAETPAQKEQTGY